MFLEQILFYVFSAILIGAASMVVITRNSVRAALFLVLAFFASAGLWLLLEAEFLALVLILVYVGAVMTLFLFVVMMLNLDTDPTRETFVRYLPFGIFIIASIVVALIYVIEPQHFGLVSMLAPAPAPASFSNISRLGMVLYTDYVYPFELAAVLLLIAIIAAISLSLRHLKRKRQTIPMQLKANPKDRLSVVKMPSEKY